MPISPRQKSCRHRRLPAVIMLMAALCRTACVTAPDPRSGAEIELTYLAGDRLDLDGRRMPPAQTVRRLRSQRIAPDTVIKISLPADAPDATMGHLMQTFQKAGYRRVVFVGERHIEASGP